MFRQTQDNDEIVDDVVDGLSDTAAPAIDLALRAWAALVEQVTSLGGLIELGIFVGSLPLAWLLAKALRPGIERIWPARHVAISAKALQVFQRLLLPILWVALLWTGSAVMGALNYEVGILAVAASLLNAWIVIRFFASFVRDPFIARLFAAFAWLVAALNILGLLGPTLGWLDAAGFEAGESRITLLKVIKALLLGGLFVWIAGIASSLIKTSLNRSRNLTPSVQTLMAQGARLALLAAAVMLALTMVGVDLTIFAVFSGAIGVGIGFGLQSIFANLMAGIILLMEKSVKVGDFVEFDNGLAGEVREINIRATLVTTNDNVDILVPNEEFIKTRVTNWTLREGFRRIRVPFGVAYGTDKDLVKKAALEAAASVEHNLNGPGAREPQVWLTEFGASSLDFELVVWIRPESVKRPSRVVADYNWAIETALSKYDIEIPFPQQDLHLRSGFAVDQRANVDSEA